MIIRRAALVAALFIAAAGPALAESMTFDLPGFTAIDISSGLNAVVTVGGTLSVTAESPSAEELNELIVEVQGDTLRAWTDWNLLDLLDFLGDRQTTITISVPALSGATASSGADVLVTGISGDVVSLNASSGANLEARATSGRAFDLSVSSGADLTVDGTCESARADASSGADLRAERLRCASVDVTSSSGADADIYASSAVFAEASSGAGISVHGNPAQVERNTSSGGDVDIQG